MGETDPSKCKALESSLWELKVLLYIYVFFKKKKYLQLCFFLKQLTILVGISRVFELSGQI